MLVLSFRKSTGDSRSSCSTSSLVGSSVSSSDFAGSHEFQPCDAYTKSEYMARNDEPYAFRYLSLQNFSDYSCYAEDSGSLDWPGYSADNFRSSERFNNFKGVSFK